jgi:acetylornithine deacetylase/succinyl-diaminopimelate desuccinylase-like protein
MTSAVATHFEKNFDSHLEDLKTLVRIPSISFPDFDHAELRKSAEAVAALLKKRGLENVEILTIPGTFPYVYGDLIRDPKLPTLLLYAHHDVQPPGREELWHTLPFDPVALDGPGGERLYGRGTADDKAGIIVHTAAIASYLEAADGLPVNVKVIIEGEEEIGSEHLAEFLSRYRDKMKADVMVLTDTANYDCGIPSLTVGLRGLVGLDLEVRSLSKTIHSGMWGGPIPDPVLALAKILSGMVDENGDIAIPAIRELVPELTPKMEESLQTLPFDESHFREQAGLVPGAKLFNSNPPALARLWFKPSLSVNAIQASSRKQAGNIINDAAWARLTIRVAPGMDAETVCRHLKDYVKSMLPWGLELKIDEEPCVNPWSTDPHAGRNKNAFAAADKALEKGYGVKPVYMGCGATIPFVKPFADVLGGAPALLIGVEDPYTNAHGENESLLISDFKKAILGQIYLFDEIAKMARS